MKNTRDLEKTKSELIKKYKVILQKQIIGLSGNKEAQRVL